jgi:hypothetical protein
MHQPPIFSCLVRSYVVWRTVAKLDVKNGGKCTKVIRAIDLRFIDCLNTAAENWWKARSSRIRCDMKGRLAVTPSFEGRLSLLRELQERFSSTTTSHDLGQQRRFVVHGLGGSGKTQLILKFIEQANNR